MVSNLVSNLFHLPVYCLIYYFNSSFYFTSSASCSTHLREIVDKEMESLFFIQSCYIPKKYTRSKEGKVYHSTRVSATLSFHRQFKLEEVRKKQCLHGGRRMLLLFVAAKVNERLFFFSLSRKLLHLEKREIDGSYVRMDFY